MRSAGAIWTVRECVVQYCSRRESRDCHYEYCYNLLSQSQNSAAASCGCDQSTLSRYQYGTISNTHDMTRSTKPLTPSPAQSVALRLLYTVPLAALLTPLISLNHSPLNVSSAARLTPADIVYHVHPSVSASRLTSHASSISLPALVAVVMTPPLIASIVSAQPSLSRACQLFPCCHSFQSIVIIIIIIIIMRLHRLYAPCAQRQSLSTLSSALFSFRCPNTCVRSPPSDYQPPAYSSSSTASSYSLAPQSFRRDHRVECSLCAAHSALSLPGRSSQADHPLPPLPSRLSSPLPAAPVARAAVAARMRLSRAWVWSSCCSSSSTAAGAATTHPRALPLPAMQPPHCGRPAHTERRTVAAAATCLVTRTQPSPLSAVHCPHRAVRHSHESPLRLSVQPGPTTRAAVPRVDLGKPLPHSPHACSVSLPHGRHVIGYEEGTAEVINAHGVRLPSLLHSSVP